MKKLSFIAANLLTLVVFSQNVTKITFDNDADLTSNFYVPDGSTGTFVDGGVLKITPGQSRTLVYDKTPDVTPSNIFSGDFVLSFKFKSNTAQLIPPTANVTNQNISVWASFFPQSAPRLNSPRIRLNLSEMYEDETYFEKGTSMNNSDASATSTPIEAVNFLRELSPAYNGDTWYTFKAIILQQGGGNVKCNFTVSDGDNELINNTYTFTGLSTTTGEIAIGGNSHNALTALSIDDFQVSTVIPAFTEHIYQETTVSGSSFHMYLPPGISSVSGILVLAPGSGANFFYVLQTDYHRKFAQAHNLALLSFQQFGSSNADLFSAVSNFATQTGHSELNNAPWMFYGFSYGTIVTQQFVNAYPEKVIAYTSDAYITPSSYNSSTYSIPGLFLSADGNNDVVYGLENTELTDLNDKRTSNAEMAYLAKEGYTHIEMGMFQLYLPIYEQILNERYLCNNLINDVNPSTGWLMDNTTWGDNFNPNFPGPMAKIYSYSSYPGDKTKASWFINKDAAYVAASFVTYYKQIALTQPYHGIEGDSRKIPIRLSDMLNSWTRIELYDYSSLIQTIHPGDSLQFTYNNIGKGAHSLIAIAIKDNKQYASFPVTLIMSPAIGSGISMPSAFDNGIVTPCTGPQTYSVKASCGQTYTWSVTGTGNTITSSNQNTATVNWKASGTVSVIAFSGSISSQPRSLTVDTDLKSEAFRVSNPKIVQNICYINVDSATQKNELHFIKPGAQNLSDSKKFVIWRKSNTEAFDSVTTIYDISTPFIDNSSDPSIKADQYYIKLIDRCGYPHLGDTTKSVHLSASSILTNNKVNFDWSTSYLNFDATYSLYKYSPSVSKHAVFIDPEFNLSYTDTLSLHSANTSYFIELSGVTGCDSSDLSATYKLRSNRISFNQTTGISQFNYSNNLIIAPNPTSGVIRVISNAENLNSVVILDALGRVVLKQKSDSLREMTIDLSDLAKGMYVIQLDSDNGSVSTKKIIKQ